MQTQAIEKQEATEEPERLTQESWYTPRVDIAETDDAFIFKADLPGVKAGDVEVDLDDGVLTIEAKVLPRQKEDQVYVLQEYGIGRYRRAFTIGAAVKVEAVAAELKNGELTLTVPKAESIKTRRVEVKGT